MAVAKNIANKNRALKRVSPLPRLVAHRGGGKLAPENTLAAIRVGHAHGYRMVEFDAMLSRDGVPVLIHDETLERTTNGHGRVCDLTLDELRQLDAGSWFGAEFAGEKIPTLEQALLLCQSLSVMANVEIKPAAGFDEQTAEMVTSMCLHHAMSGARLLLSSFSLGALQIARMMLDVTGEEGECLPLGVLYDQVPADWQNTVSQLRASTLHTNARHVTEALITQAHDAGVPVLCYTVNEMAEAQHLLQLGVTSLFTDQLDMAQTLA